MANRDQSDDFHRSVTGGPDWSRATTSPPPRPTSCQAADALLAVHATDPATVYLSLLARCGSASLADVAAALYDTRALVRMMAMRRTMFVVPAESWPSSTTRRRSGSRRRCARRCCRSWRDCPPTRRSTATSQPGSRTSNAASSAASPRAEPHRPPNCRSTSRGCAPHCCRRPTSPGTCAATSPRRCS